MPLFSSFGWIDSYINQMVERSLNDWTVTKYADCGSLYKIPDSRLQEQREIIKKEIEGKIYFWRKWWEAGDGDRSPSNSDDDE